MGAVLRPRRALLDSMRLSAIRLVAPLPRFLAAQQLRQHRRVRHVGRRHHAVWMIVVLLFTPTCAFIPKYHCLPFLV